MAILKDKKWVERKDLRKSLETFAAVNNIT
jgi:hypothetical protein